MPDSFDEFDSINNWESSSDSDPDFASDPESASESDAASESDSGDENEENMLIHNLHNQNLMSLVRAFRQNHRGIIGTSFNTLLDFAKRNDIRSFIRYIGSKEFRQAFMKVVKKHKWKILLLSLGILLMCNPVAMAGFGALGPVAGTFV
jgi:hypothetical protein